MPNKQNPGSVEAILHEEAKRTNIPTSELQAVVPEKQKAPVNMAYAKRNADLDPQLVWRGKYDGADDLEVKAPPLYIQEKIHPKALIEELRVAGQIKKGNAGLAEELAQYQCGLFSDFNGVPREADKTDFYQHEQNWTNRMILGDSLQVMASLSEREGLRGQVQAIYLDPPYGIKFNSNFQWSTNNRVQAEGKDFTREPEQVKAFRDTWEDGIHSYLSYLRDRFIVARDLLNDSGSIFVQIGDDNVHKVKLLLDEIFGEYNFNSQITYISTSGLGGENLAKASNYILWYAKNKENMKFNRLLKAKSYGGEGSSAYKKLETNSLDRFSINEYEQLYSKKVDFFNNKEIKIFALDNITSSNHGQGVGSTGFSNFMFQGKNYSPGKGSFKTHRDGMARLAKARRLDTSEKGNLGYVRFFDDFAAFPLNNIWTDTLGQNQFGGDKIYVVQTGLTIVRRCLLMATDPGDLVLDPTCGSGTTAYVAEQWGRRWITIDTSRVALALARARLMGARYPWYLMADSPEGQARESEASGRPPSTAPCGNNINMGFVYERVPHITLKAIANNVQIDEIWEKWQTRLEPLRQKLNEACGAKWEEWEIPREADESLQGEAKKIHAQWWKARLARQAEIDESIMARAEYELLYDKPYVDKKRIRVAGPFTVESISPYRTLGVDENDDVFDPQAVNGGSEGKNFVGMIIENLRSAGVQQAHKEDKINFTSLTEWPGEMICAEGRYLEGENEKRAAIFIGPEFGTVSRADLADAATEAAEAKFDILIACAFNYDANSEELRKMGKLPIIKARMNADLHMSAALKKTDKGNLFVVFGEPDIEIVPEMATGGLETGNIMVKINGVDVYNPARGEIISDNANDIACWFVDTNYNGESFYVRQAYFLGQKSPYESLKRALNAEIDKDIWESLNSAISRPFPKPANGRIAVKVINHLGDEVMKIFRVRE